jgi:hypothetical protein
MTQVQFQVTLRPTVCRPVRLGAGPPVAHNLILISLFDIYFVFSAQGSLTHISHEQGESAQVKVKVKSQGHVSAVRNF